MVGKKNIRDYEVSIWTLQDSFITVLKAFNLENKEKIQEPLLHLKDDGENTFSFEIPMYITRNDKFVQNPIWYTTKNGNIVANMRKIKIIFNKNFDKEEVFEFIIIKVTEKHEGYSKICEVECESLAFHELGKQGYSITLSEDDFLAEYEDWLANPGNQEEPRANIDYWISKVLKNSDWDYLVCMDWSAEDGYLVDNSKYINDETYREEIDEERETQGLRSKQKIYRPAYVSSWIVSNNSLTPEQVVDNFEELEKIAIVEGAESNRYNLLQSIAEAFQVFCKFVYEHDSNYHIINKKVIFYNNFISEADGFLDFNYGYNTQEVSREIDSNDLISKMYVKSLSDSGTLLGTINLNDSSADKGLENYLLNFDYLYEIGTISQEQYDLIPEYLAQLHQINSELINLNNELTSLNNELPIVQAKIKTAEDGIVEANRRIGESDQFLQNITGSKSSLPEYGIRNPFPLTVIHRTSGNNSLYYSDIYIEGVVQHSLKIYSARKTGSSEVDTSKEVGGFTFTFDSETGNITRINYSTNPNAQQVYAIFSYDPSTPQKIIAENYSSKKKNDEEILADNKEKENVILTRIEEIENSIEENITEKDNLISRFERIMGPALREGYWQPDNNYASYQINRHTKSYNLTTFVSEENSSEAGFYWDSESLQEEKKNYYYSGVELAKTYYPCIILSQEILSAINSLEILDNLFLVYKDIGAVINGSFAEDDPRGNHYLSLSAADGGEIAFLQYGNNGGVIPVIMITGAQKMLQYQNYSVQQQLQQNARLSIIVGYNSKTDRLEETRIADVSASSNWLSNLEEYNIVYPRFYVNNKNFITSTPENKVYFGNNELGYEALEENYDYYTLFHDGKWLITLKEKNIILNLDKLYYLQYSITAAADAIYLDAVEILKENSMPKVSYSITPLAIDEKMVNQAYNSLGQLAHINDPELNFENVQGYISEVELNLDRFWEDKYTIKNYKTKFEDLFSTIVAQTEEMKKNSQFINMASSLIDANGNLHSDKIIEALSIEDLLSNFSFDAMDIRAVEDKVALLNSGVYKVVNGEVGLAFPKTTNIESIVLNNEVGLKIDGIMGNNGEISTSFRVTNGEMGFFKIGNDGNPSEGMLYFDANSGDMALAGTIYAKNGWFGGERGWIISNGINGIKDKDANEISTIKAINSSLSTSDLTIGEDLGGLLYSANGKVIFASGSDSSNPFMGFYSSNYGQDPKFIFDGTNVYLNGTIVSNAGEIGGWTIDNHSLYSTTTVSDVLRGTGLQKQTAGQWAIAVGYTNQTNWTTAPFRVDHTGNLVASSANITGSITATSGKIGGFNITNTANQKATSANGGHRYAISLYGNSADSTYEYEVGMKSDASANNTTTSGNLAFYVLRKVKNSTWETNPDIMFGVSHSGRLFAINADIAGTINATSGTIGAYATNKINIGTNTTNASLYSGMTGLTSTANGFYIGTDGIALGGGKFKVTNAGALTTSNITATGGTVGGWTIGSNYIGNGNSRGLSTIGMSNPSNSSDYVFWAGATAQSGDSVKTDAKFSVTKAGLLTATGANITGTITANNLYLTALSGTGTTNVAEALRNLLLRTDTDDTVDDAGEANGIPGMMITNYRSGSWIKVRKQDGTEAKVSFGNSSKLAQARSEGYDDGRASVTTASITDKTLVAGTTYRFSITLGNGKTTSSDHNCDDIYNDGKSDGKSGVTMSGHSFSSQRTGSTLIVYSNVTLSNGKTYQRSTTYYI